MSLVFVSCGLRNFYITGPLCYYSHSAASHLHVVITVIQLQPLGYHSDSAARAMSSINYMYMYMYMYIHVVYACISGLCTKIMASVGSAVCVICGAQHLLPAQ